MPKAGGVAEAQEFIARIPRARRMMQCTKLHIEGDESSERKEIRDLEKMVSAKSFEYHRNQKPRAANYGAVMVMARSWINTQQDAYALNTRRKRSRW